MADSNHLGARTEDLMDDDPFAELTRIMGQGSVVRPRPVDDAAQSFSLDLDLEKELLGDFTADDDAVSTPKVEPEFNVAEAFGENESADIFKGSALDEFERALASDPVFAQEPAPASQHAVNTGDLAGTLDNALADADWSLSATRQEPAFGGFSSHTQDEPFEYARFEEPRETAEPEIEDQFNLSDSIFAPRQDTNVLSPRVDDFFDTSVHEPAPEPSFRDEPSFDGMLDAIDLHSDHTQPAAEPDPFEAALSSELLENAFEDTAPVASDPVAASESSIEEELANALNFGDWTRVEKTAAPAEQAWPEAVFAQAEPQSQQEWPEPQAAEPQAEETDWAAELSDVFAEEQSTQSDMSWVDSQKGWNQPAQVHDWTVDPASIRNAVPAAANPVQDYANYEQSLPQGSVQDQQVWSQQDDGYQWGTGTTEAGSYDGAPEIDTVEIPEKAVVVTEDLDLPHVPYQEDVKPAAQLDDIEELLSGAFGSLEQPAAQEDDSWGKAEPAKAAEADDSEFDDFFTADLAAASAAALARSGYGQAAAPQLSNDWDSPLGYEQAPRPMPGTPPPAPARDSLFSRRGVQIAALLAGVAIIGGGGVLAYNFIGGGSGETVLIKADNSPIKEKPENPGGQTIPNQESQVYRQVAGETSGNPVGGSQLISGAEEPVELPSPNDEPDDIGEVLAEEEAENFSQELASNEQPSGAETVAKSEERLVSNDQQEQGTAPGFATLTPKKVRSYIVRPDGTMVLRETETPATTNAEPLPGVPNDRIEVAARAPAQQEEGLVAGQEVPPLNGASAPAAAPAATDADQVTSMPRSAPIPAPRPASAPRTVAAAPAPAAPATPAQQPAAAPAPAAPTQVAAAQPAAPQTTAASSGWSVQIASQPSLEAAQQSYQSMAQRYGSMLQGKGVNIVKAEVPGKGTYYRVRIPAGSKNDAIALCERLKSQGGTCFVSQ